MTDLAASPLPQLTQPLRDLAAWTAYFRTAEIPVLAETAEALEALRANEDAVDANGIGETLANDPLMALKVLAHAAAHRSARVVTDVETVRGVRHGRASLTGPRDAPTLWLAVTTAADADLGRLRRHLATSTLPALRAALGQPDLPAQITVAVSNRSSGREVS